MPSNARLGQEHTVGVSFKGLGTGKGGMVEFTTGIAKGIPIIVKSKDEVSPTSEAVRQQQFADEKATSPDSTTLAFYIIIVVVIVYIIFRGKGKKKK